MNLNILIPIAPTTKKNSNQIIKAKGRYMIIPSSAYKKYEKECGKYLPKIEPIDQPCNVKCIYYMPTHRRVDLSNLLSCTLDVLVKYRVLADDNANIVISMDGSRVDYDKDTPRTEIEITLINCPQETGE